MTNSKYLNALSASQLDDLRNKLWDAQGGKCFICEQPIVWEVHASQVDIDHVDPSANDGKDDPSNFALTHSSCNRSKQDTNLRVARVLSRFDRLTEKAKAESGRGANLADVLADSKGAKYALSFNTDGSQVTYSLDEIGDPSVRTVPLLTDTLSGDRYFFVHLPVEYLHHDEQINPRNIGSALQKLIKEFHAGNPQLHVALAWVNTDSGTSKVMVFDGQHKAAAQLLLSVRALPVRVFVNPDTDKILATNTRAGTTLRQVAFDKSVQRRLGASLFSDRIDRYRKDHGLAPDDETFSEKAVASYFAGQRREVKRYAIDSIRNAIVHDPENHMTPFVEFGGRSTEKPLSYSTIEKTFLSKFVYGDVLDTPMDFMVDEGLNPRMLEVEQIVHLMNLIAEEILIGKVDPEIGGTRLENRVAKGENIDGMHLRAYRLSREEVLSAWLDLVDQVIKNYFSNVGVVYESDRLFQNRFDEPLWQRLTSFTKNFAALPVWVNHDLASTAFGGKRVSSYWSTVFKTGKTSDGIQVLAEPINLMDMIKG